MKYQHKKSNNIIVFSKWTRKNYAIFASLHKVVNIVRLSVDICNSSFGKNQSILRLLKLDTNKDISESDTMEKDSLFSEWLMVLLLELGIVTVDESYNFTNLHLGINKSPYFTIM